MKQFILITALISAVTGLGAQRLTKSQLNAAALIIKAADDVGVPRELLLAICWTESSYRTVLAPHMDGGSESYGVCQIKLATASYIDRVWHHKHLASTERLKVTYINANYAAKYLRMQLRRYKGNWQKAVDAYNCGTARNPNSRYVRKVKARLGVK